MTRPRGRSVDRIDTTTGTETERSPLLAGTPTPTTRAVAGTPALAPAPQQQNTDNDSPPDPLTHLRARLRPRVILLSLILMFLLELGAGIMVTPANALMESIICRQMHPEVSASSTPPLPPPPVVLLPDGGPVVLAADDDDDPVCKSPDVQGYLAMLRGWAQTFDCLPGIAGAVPYGVLSDRWGRRPVMGLAVLGIVLGMAFTYAVFFFSDVVPLWVTWFSAAFQLIGGGGPIVIAMLYTIIADVVAVGERATVFFQIAAVFLGSQMVAGPLGGIMLVWNPWFPLLVSLAVLIVANLFVFAFPETVHLHDRNPRPGDQDADADGRPKLGKLWHKTWTGLAGVWDFVLGNKSLAVLMLSLLFAMLGRMMGEVLLQYATDRYGWSWSTASMVLTVRNAGSLVTLLVLLPNASWLCVERLGMAAVAKDLWLARWSGMVQVAGSLLIAAAVNGVFFSFGLAWFALGSGMASLIRSLLNALVEEHHVGTLNSLLGVTETVGVMVAGPLLAKSLSVGLNLGGAWIGLPFVTTALFFAVSTTVLWAFKLPDRRWPSSVEPPC